jgi:hypothetical protein
MRSHVLLILLVVGAGHAHAAGTAGAQCASAKAKAAAKEFGQKLKCYEKALGSGANVDAQCLTSAETKYGVTITKIETKGGCALSGDGPTLGAIVDRAVSDVIGFVPTAAPSCCMDGAGGCIYVAVPGECTFTLGAAGTVCDGVTGGCVAAPATPGNCCSNPSGLVLTNPSKCGGGPQFDATTCADDSGTFVPNALCPPTGAGSCVAF